jgi:hypothetical protein
MYMYSLLTLAGLILGFTRSRCWFFLSGLASLFLLLNTIKGRYPAEPAGRCLGVRTAKKSDSQKLALRKRWDKLANDNQALSTSRLDDPGI